MIAMAKGIGHADERDRRHQVPFKLLERHGADAKQVAQDDIDGDDQDDRQANPCRRLPNPVDKPVYRVRRRRGTTT